MMKDVMIGTWAWGPGNNGSKMVFGQSYDENSLRETFDEAVRLGLIKWDTAAVYGLLREAFGEVHKWERGYISLNKIFP